jgi:glycosyltransferase involved in cell wall biosynthesis
VVGTGVMNLFLSSHKHNGITRIAIFVPTLLGGGAERVMMTLANAFAARGYAVDLVLAVAEGPYLSQVSDSVHIVDLKAGRVIMALWPLLRYLRRHRPVAMLSAMTHSNVVALLARALACVPTRLVVSERSTITVDSSLAHGGVARLLYALVPLLYPRADGIVAVSQASANDLVGFAGLAASSVEAIYNPFDLQRIKILAAATLTHHWFAAGQPPVVLAIGRLTEQKDFSNLIRAFARLRDSRPARLMILGEGELRSELEAQADSCGLTMEDIQMPGFVANPFAYLAHCGVFVLSSRWEGLPGVLIEAMACGAPVVATDCPSGPHEILEGGRWGSLVPVGDEDALVKAIDESLVTSRAQLPDVRKRAEDFELERAVARYLAVLLPRGDGCESK